MVMDACPREKVAAVIALAALNPAAAGRIYDASEEGNRQAPACSLW